MILKPNIKMPMHNRSVNATAAVPRLPRGHLDRFVMAAQAGPAGAGHSHLVSRFLRTPKTL